jgi:hypothetical protein
LSKDISLPEKLSKPPVSRDIPKDWKPGFNWDGEQGELTTEPMAQQPNWDDLLRERGWNPDEVEIVGNVRHSQWQQRDGGDYLNSYRVTIRKKVAEVDLPALFAAVKKTKVKPVSQMSGEALVVVWSDTQTGKTDHRGGTPELIARVMDKRAKLEAYIKAHKTSSAFFLNAGDSIEGFENVDSQYFTNDLSLVDQIDLEATFEWEMLGLLRKYHDKVTAATVGSNHCAWRKGKATMGKPTDDWGLFITRQLKKMSDIAGLGIDFVEPAPYQESVCVDVDGTIIGLVHGHQAPSGGFTNWWAKQAHGGAPLAHADVAISGHYHTLSIQPSGRNPYTGRSKWHLQAPTLDNGSSWFANTSGGSDSDAGLLVFTIGSEGLNLQSLAVL